MICKWDSTRRHFFTSDQNRLWRNLLFQYICSAPILSCHLFWPLYNAQKNLNYYKTALKYPIGIWIQKQKSTQNAVLKTAQIPFFEVWNWVVGVERMLKKRSEYQLCIFSSRIMIFDARSKATIKYYVICHLQTK